MYVYGLSKSHIMQTYIPFLFNLIWSIFHETKYYLKMLGKRLIMYVGFVFVFSQVPLVLFRNYKTLRTAKKREPAGSSLSLSRTPVLLRSPDYSMITTFSLCLNNCILLSLSQQPSQLHM